jgi:SPP1 gp7 family putative phage head morphogenesis protein
MNNIAMAQAVQAAAKRKFYGHKVLKSKVMPQYPVNLEREYMRITNTYMTLLNKTIAKQMPEIKRALDAEYSAVRLDDNQSVTEVIKKSFFAIIAEFEEISEKFELERRLVKLADLATKMKISEWKRIVHKTLGISIFDDYYKGEFFREMLKIWTANNVNLIKTIPKTSLNQMMDIVQEGYATGKRNTAIGKELQEKYGIERRHAQFIARDQIAKLNADITQAQQKDAGVEEYVWSTSGDVRVRDRHKELDGKRFRWSDPPVIDERTGRRGHPGQDYQCRCVALPVFNLPELNLPWESNNTETTKTVQQENVAKMSPSEIYKLYQEAINESIDPSLNTESRAQHFAQKLGINGKPAVVSEVKFEKTAANSEIPVLYRGVDPPRNGSMTAKEITRRTMFGDKTFYGTGGAGDGIYFSTSESDAHDFALNGGAVMKAVISNDAKVITPRELYRKLGKMQDDFDEDFEGTIDNSSAALALGYNVLNPQKGVYVVLDRSVLTFSDLVEGT